MATITSATDRFGNLYWVVRWGEGVTQQAICWTRTEADQVAVHGYRGLARVEPLVSFRITPAGGAGCGVCFVTDGVWTSDERCEGHAHIAVC